MSLAEVANAVDGVLLGGDAVIGGVATDSRLLRPGELFVALKGPRFDGHAFVADAAAKHAAAALLSQQVATSLPAVVVQDTRLALGRLAAHWRARFSIPLVAVTGSNGKTTVKTMLGAILGVRHEGLVTEGNLNNDIGVPLMLCRLRAEHRFAVIEMGMNHAGEIDYLSGLARPTVAVITNAAAAHLEGLRTVAAVAAAKGEVFNGLSADGVAVINADDEYAPLWRRLAGHRRRLEFSLRTRADVLAEYRLGPEESEVRLRTALGDIDLTLPLPGRHNVANAAAACAAALAVGSGTEEIRRGLSGIGSVNGRLMLLSGRDGARVYNDTYNANPASVLAALEVLALTPGERVLVLGDMAELGADARSWHARVGQSARSLGIERVFGLGGLSRAAVEAFGDGGKHFESKQALIDALLGVLHGGMSVLVKGSRRMRMEDVVAAIVDGRAGVH